MASPPSRPLSLAAGARLGPYEVVGPLGAGGMGEVYRARDTRLDRAVALKLLPRDIAAGPDGAERVRRFEQEARAAGALDHPNVLAVHDVGRHDGAPYLVCELLEGQTLRQRLIGGPLPPRKAVDLVLQATRGLAAAHDKGIVHRDLKPDNLFVTRDGRVKILDFGLAKLAGTDAEVSVDARTEPGRVLGTVGYMAPEQVRGRAADHRADLFALGAILYEMVVGERAFTGETDIDAMTAILKEEPRRLAEVPPELARVIQHCIEKAPEERFQSARDLAFDLETLSTAAQAAPTRSLPRLPALRMARPGARRWPIAAAALALAAVAATGGWLARRGERAPPSFQRLTFRRGTVRAARFAPDGQTIVYAAAWGGAPTALYTTLPGSTESRALGVDDAEILAVSSRGEMALLLRPRLVGAGLWVRAGTLAQAPLAGGTPRELLDEVQAADWAPDGASLAVVRDVDGACRLEFPVGHELHRTSGWISHPRVAPAGDRVAFIDHPVRGDDAGAVAVVDLAGHRRALTGDFRSAQGLAWGPRGELWFTAADGRVRALYAVDARGRRRELLRTPGPLTLHDVARDGRVLASSDVLRSGIVAQPPSEGGRAREEEDLSWLDWSVAMDLSADGRTLLFDEESEGGGPSYHVYLRPTDGGPAVRIGEGRGTGLSPDGKSVLAIPMGATPAPLMLVPTGVGMPRPFPADGLHHDWASFFPDGRRVLFAGHAPGRATQLFVQDLDGGAARPISPEGMDTLAVVAPDGRHVAGMAGDRQVRIYPIDGGDPRPVPGVEAGEVPLRFTSDGAGLYVYRVGEVPARVVRVDLASGRREPFRDLLPRDRDGLVALSRILVTPSGSAWAYRYFRALSDLYLIEDVE